MIDNQGDKINLEEVDINNWIIKPRMIGKQSRKKTEVFIEIVVNNYLGVLIKPNITLLKEERLSLQVKTTIIEYTVKIGIVLEPNLQFASKINYENDIYTKLKYDQRIVEIKRDITYEKSYKSQCIAIMAIQSEQERVDNNL